MLAAIVFSLLAQDPGRSLYVWRTEEADSKLIAFCAERKVTRLYLMVGSKTTEPIRDFVKAAHEIGRAHV